MNLPYPDSTHPGNTGGRAKRPDNRPQDPIEAPAPGVASVTQLINKLSDYLTPAELKKVKEAYRFSDEMHLGQVRKSGEPYISHPIAVAEICAEWKLDAQAIMAWACWAVPLLLLEPLLQLRTHSSANRGCSARA